MLLNTLKK